MVRKVEVRRKKVEVDEKGVNGKRKVELEKEGSFPLERRKLFMNHGLLITGRPVQARSHYRKTMRRSSLSKKNAIEAVSYNKIYKTKTNHENPATIFEEFGHPSSKHY
jgi:hypothetical protein